MEVNSNDVVAQDSEAASSTRIIALDPPSSSSDSAPRGIARSKMRIMHIATDAENGEEIVPFGWWKGTGYDIFGQEVISLPNGKLTFTGGEIVIKPGVTTHWIRVYNNEDAVVFENVEGKALFWACEVNDGRTEAPPISDDLFETMMRVIIMPDDEGTVIQFMNYGTTETRLKFWAEHKSTDVYKVYADKSKEEEEEPTITKFRRLG